MSPIGVAVTNDIKKFLASEPECVLYTGRDFVDWRQNGDIAMLLEAGINVVTAFPYHFR